MGGNYKLLDSEFLHANFSGREPWVIVSGESLITMSSLSDDGITLREKSASLGESNERWEFLLRKMRLHTLHWCLSILPWVSQTPWIFSWMSKLRTNDFEADLEDVLKSDLENSDWELTAESEMTSLGMEDNHPLQPNPCGHLRWTPCEVLLSQVLEATAPPWGEELHGRAVLCL